MIIAITGAAGFIGSCLTGKLNALGFNNLILVDLFNEGPKSSNLKGKNYEVLIDREIFPNEELHDRPDVIFHIGARTDTTEFDTKIFDHLNVQSSIRIWEYATKHQIPFIYASSAATYGNGDSGFDDESEIGTLVPMNPYGWSKQKFDLWVQEQTETPPNWYGFKFFNVYGPNEYHKGRMASVIFHAWKQIKDRGSMKLFASHRPEFENGGQQRDFIYVMDLLDIMIFAWQHRIPNGLYNLGTGQARSFNDLAKSVFAALNLPANIEYIPTPEDIRDTYQYYTRATMTKLIKAGYQQPFTSLEDGVRDYVQNYLETQFHY